ncbi:MAG: TetR/AcrR family transcriptional regulator [Tepidiformaceae bacterium]
MVAEDTRERILDAAEHLFSERGFDGTSIRDVTAEAAVNLAAVHYHFGSKEDLLRAVLERIVLPTNIERLRLMEEAYAEPGGPLIADLLRAFILPELRLARDLGPRGQCITRLIGRMFSEPNEVVHQLAADLFSEVGGCLIQGLQQALPDLPEEEVAFRMQCVVGVFTFFMADTVPSPWKLIDLNDPEGATERLVTFLEPALSAPATVLPQRKGGVDIPA